MPRDKKSNKNKGREKKKARQSLQEKEERRK